MADYNAKVAPFINTLFYVTAQAGVYPSGGYHSGLDISTGTGTRGANLYSICNGTVLRADYNEGGYGNFIIIKDDESNYAFLFGHMAEPALKKAGDKIKIGEQFGIEGATGNVTGLHTHVEMQNYVENGNTWIYASGDSSLFGKIYLAATDYMGFPNQLGISVYYDGEALPPTPPGPGPDDPVTDPTLRKKSKYKTIVNLRKRLVIKL